jgi:hypothetical protein
MKEYRGPAALILLGVLMLVAGGIQFGAVTERAAQRDAERVARAAVKATTPPPRPFSAVSPYFVGESGGQYPSAREWNLLVSDIDRRLKALEEKK